MEVRYDFDHMADSPDATVTQRNRYHPGRAAQRVWRLGRYESLMLGVLLTAVTVFFSDSIRALFRIAVVIGVLAYRTVRRG